MQTETEEIIEELTEKAEGGGEDHAGTAKRYHMARLVVLALLVLFVILTLILGRGELKAENFRYFARYFRINPFRSSSVYFGIDYTGNSDTRFAMYKEDLLVFSDGEMTLYNLSGKKLISSSLTSSDSFDADGRYLAIYRRGGYIARLYNSFSEIGEIQTDHPITDISTSQGGGFAVTASDAGGDEVTVYDKSLDAVYTCAPSGRQVLFAALSPDGKALGIFSEGVEDGEIFSEILIKSTLDDKTLYSEKIYGEMPLGIFFCDGGGLFSLTDKKLRAIGSGFGGEKEISFSGDVVFAGCAGDDFIVCERGKYSSELNVRRISDAGKLRAEYTVPGEVYRMTAGKERIYFLSSDRIYVCGDGVSSVAVQSGAADLFELSDGKVLLCYSYGTALADAG